MPGLTSEDCVSGDWWSAYRKSGAVQVWHVDLRHNASREAEAFGQLSSEEQARWRRFLYRASRRRYALCRAALRTLLCGHLGCRSEKLEFQASSHGKPFALVEGRPAPVSFNVSHSGDHGLIAIAPRGRLGVDVEERRTRHDLDGPIAEVLDPSERAELATASGERKVHLFFFFWTIKEALIKALGTGHSIDVAQVQVPLVMRDGESRGVFRFQHLPEVEWRVDDLGNEDFAGAIAHEIVPEPGAYLDFVRPEPGTLQIEENRLGG